MAAGRYGRGKVVAFGHNGYINNGGEEKVLGRLLFNAVEWAGGRVGGECFGLEGEETPGTNKTKSIGFIGLTEDAEEDTVRLLQEQAQTTDSRQHPDWSHSGGTISFIPPAVSALIDRSNVIVWNGAGPRYHSELIPTTPSKPETITSAVGEQATSEKTYADVVLDMLLWLYNGGGLVVGMCPWGWDQLMEGQVRGRTVDVRVDNVINVLLSKIGLILLPQYLPEECKPYVEKEEKSNTQQKEIEQHCGSVSENGGRSIGTLCGLSGHIGWSIISVLLPGASSSFRLCLSSSPLKIVASSLSLFPPAFLIPPESFAAGFFQLGKETIRSENVLDVVSLYVQQPRPSSNSDSMTAVGVLPKLFSLCVQRLLSESSHVPGASPSLTFPLLSPSTPSSSLDSSPPDSHIFVAWFDQQYRHIISTSSLDSLAGVVAPGVQSFPGDIEKCYLSKTDGTASTAVTSVDTSNGCCNGPTLPADKISEIGAWRVRLCVREVGWQSTGFYCAPGQKVTLTWKQQIKATGENSSKVAEGEEEEGRLWRCQIGCHTDRLDLFTCNAPLKRWPNITTSSTVRTLGTHGETTLDIISPYGGLLYIECLTPYRPSGDFNRMSGSSTPQSPASPLFSVVSHLAYSSRLHVANTSSSVTRVFEDVIVQGALPSPLFYFPTRFDDDQPTVRKWSQRPPVPKQGEEQHEIGSVRTLPLRSPATTMKQWLEFELAPHPFTLLSRVQMTAKSDTEAQTPNHELSECRSPWGEVGTDLVVFSLPTISLRRIAPSQLKRMLGFWDSAVLAQLRLSCQTLYPHPEINFRCKNVPRRDFMWGMQTAAADAGEDGSPRKNRNGMVRRLWKKKSIDDMGGRRTPIECNDGVCGTDGVHLICRRERVVCDIQPSAGYMHSGYPIVTHMDVAMIPTGAYCLRKLEAEEKRKEGVATARRVLKLMDKTRGRDGMTGRNTKRQKNDKEEDGQLVCAKDLEFLCALEETSLSSPNPPLSSSHPPVGLRRRLSSCLEPKHQKRLRDESGRKEEEEKTGEVLEWLGDEEWQCCHYMNRHEYDHLYALCKICQRTIATCTKTTTSSSLDYSDSTSSSSVCSNLHRQCSLCGRGSSIGNCQLPADSQPCQYPPGCGPTSSTDGSPVPASFSEDREMDECDDDMELFDVCTLADMRVLPSNGSWGLFHELGHNRQKPEWTSEGMGEVTVNIFTLCCMYRCCNITTPLETKWMVNNRQEAMHYLRMGNIKDHTLLATNRSGGNDEATSTTNVTASSIHKATPTTATTTPTVTTTTSSRPLSAFSRLNRSLHNLLTCSSSGGTFLLCGACSLDVCCSACQLAFKQVWQQQPGVGIFTFATLQAIFGWELFERVFVAYEMERATHTSLKGGRKKSPGTDSTPTTNGDLVDLTEEEKREKWIVMTSEAAGYDLRCFYTLWKWQFRYDVVGKQLDRKLKICRHKFRGQEKVVELIDCCFDGRRLLQLLEHVNVSKARGST
eukprot:GHVS01040938.1.p1 GENE.GHVS01040938.1~~GHVS01040938.1.p1  ORF type:complete len:1609 (-),score=260.66 GHVS01040938.1:232-4668(-)